MCYPVCVRAVVFIADDSPVRPGADDLANHDVERNTTEERSVFPSMRIN